VQLREAVLDVLRERTAEADKARRNAERERRLNELRKMNGL
jgi:hypothetical protein